ncbi:MAG: ATP-binding protein [Desulfitobacterium hafniense]|nr:ATP-binding protein [Desulfitobacterium hafniense]
MLDLVKKVFKQSTMLSDKLPELMPGGVSIAIDTTCQKIVHNPVAARFFGIEDWGNFSPLNFPSFKVLHNGKVLLTDELPIVRSARYGDEVSGFELEFAFQEGISKIAIVSSCPLKNELGVIIGAMTTFEEVTELIHNTRNLSAHGLSLGLLIDDRTKELREEFDKREQIELEVTKLERLNLIGQLAAGLGHEVRNPMTTIRGFLQILHTKSDLLPYKSYFDLMIEELDRANSIITDFLSIAKNKSTEFKRQCLNTLLTNLFPLILAYAYSQDKKCNFEPGEITELDIDSSEITQLVLNLARNGLEAMHNNGYLTIRTFMDNQFIVLSVKDEGTGIKPEDVLKLGTPFFTTKENGTGLGIPMCYNIARRHFAKIEVKSGSEGTTFLIRFPQHIGNGAI